ncbi:GTPase Era, mitochondrial [Microplitis demolitor]|uniref:GTPase Era, mitochondrial n=1 Tax=Microplitis demolitor TaxID=69319 RepID=UPI0004CD1374|nr:GTPase Era, mitochondrial [Microplitis demolitor]
MLFTLERTILRIKPRVFRFYSVNANNASNDMSNNSYENYIIDESWEPKAIRSDDAKTLRVSILGLPNVGKSTLINQLVGRPICAASSKIQTTRKNSDAIYMENNTQLIFVDTPGLVTNRDMKKYDLEKTFKTDVDKAVAKSDIVGVVQDASHKFKADVIDERIMVVLKNLRVGIPTLLILNKVDKVKKKRKLLELVETLTSDQNWPNFSDIFMVSALNSDGVNDLRTYLLDSAKPRDWDYESTAISNDSPEIIIERAVRAKFMDALPKELPYAISVQLEHYSVLEDDSISAAVAITCPSDRISKLVMGKRGVRVRNVATSVEQELCQTFRTTVRLKIAIKFSQSKEESKVANYKSKKWIF